ncbi:serine/threonine-protein kinase [Arthrobacter sp. ISL-5]|uniref:serine/threonine-protein kinase n=1 Tax=Arthrobacter sp. ISL-5 TaxID=2819111 RepID=UPI001BE7631F|nr:serine/threonine-protein kinase [Arthrobacter sp. ISL-5]MBT2555770.1 serine/threonine protein kinase [Arthrobacter sp. ISL-5]
MDEAGRETEHYAGEPRVAGYQVCRWLGRGGSAGVWLVTEEATGRTLALKCLGAGAGSRAAGTSGVLEGDLRREILIMSVLDHEHLIRAHDVVRTGEPGANGWGLLMDYAPGGSLGQLIRARGRLSVGETVTVLTPVAQVLGYLHGRGFTHSDVSPGNVLFSAHGKPLLADLGVARMVGDPSGVPDLGTAGFTDPAPVDAVRAGLQPERDVYAAAAVGWYCLTGEPPLPAADRPPLSALVPEVPAELAAALEAGLSEDRRQRPAAAELATAVYRSACATPVDLSRSVHTTVLPELLTRRQGMPPRGPHRERVLAWWRRLSTSRLFLAVGQRRGGGGGVAPSLRFRSRSAAAAGLPAAEPAADAVAAVTGPEPPAAPRHRARRAVTDSQHRSSRRAVTASPARRRRRTAAMAGILTAPAIAGAFLLVPWAQSSNDSVGSQTGHPPAAQGAPAPGPAAVPDAVRNQLRAKNPDEAVRGLAWLRSMAFRDGKPELLAEVNAGNSPAAEADGKISARLQDSGSVLAGFTTNLTSVRTLPESTGARAVVAVTSATSGYEERLANGTVIAVSGPLQGQELRLVLVPVNGTWRIADILPAA